jgi:hypothetical protein
MSSPPKPTEKKIEDRKINTKRKTNLLWANGPAAINHELENSDSDWKFDVKSLNISEVADLPEEIVFLIQLKQIIPRAT